MGFYQAQLIKITQFMDSRNINNNLDEWNRVYAANSNLKLKNCFGQFSRRDSTKTEGLCGTFLVFSELLRKFSKNIWEHLVE